MANKNNLELNEISIWEFVFDGFLEGLRKGGGISPRLARDLNSKETMDVFRSRLVENDIEFLCEIAVGDAPEIRRLAVSWLKRWQDYDIVRSLFFEQWKVEKDISCRLNLLWRLLDYGDISVEFHHELYQYVCENWDAFLQTQLYFLGAGNPSAVLENVRARLQSPNEKRTKDWAYLCAAFASDDGFGVFDLLEEYKHRSMDPNAIVNKVLDDLFDRILTVPCNYTISDQYFWDKILPTKADAQRCSISASKGHNCQPRSSQSVIDSLYHDALQSLISSSDIKRCLKHVRFCRDIEARHLNDFFIYRNGDRDGVSCLPQFSGQTLIEHWAQATAACEWANRFFLAMKINEIPESNCERDAQSFFGTRADPRTLCLNIPNNMVAAEYLSSRLPWPSPQGEKKSDRGKAVPDAITFNRNLCQQLRIVQWEVMPRNLVSEVFYRQIVQEPMTSALKIPALLGSDDQYSLAMASWDHAAQTVQMEKSGSSSDILLSLSTDLPKRIKKWFESAKDSYSAIFASLSHPDNYLIKGNIYKDFLRWTIQRDYAQKRKHLPNKTLTDLILVQDGEITFYSLLWLIRMMHDDAGDYSHLLPDSPASGGKDFSRFRLHKRYGQWSKILNNYSGEQENDGNIFPVDLGLFVPVGDSQKVSWYATERLRSLLEWMLDVSINCISGDWDSVHTSYLLQKVAERLGCKTPPESGNAKKDYENQCGDILSRLYCVFASDEVRLALEISLRDLSSPFCIEKLGKHIRNILLSNAEEMRHEFLSDHPSLGAGLKEHLAIKSDCGAGSDSQKMNVLNWLLTANPINKGCENSLGHCFHDVAIVRLSRTCFLPLEFLLRRFQPYEMHLIEVPFDFQQQDHYGLRLWADSGLDRSNLIIQPTGIAFATVIGRVPKAIARMERAQDTQTCTICQPDDDWCKAQEWLATYWAVLHGLAGGINAKTYRINTEELENTISEHKQVHELMYVIAGIQEGFHEDVYDAIRRYFYSVVLDEKRAKLIVENSKAIEFPEEYYGLYEIDSLKSLLQRAYALAKKIESLASLAMVGQLNDTNLLSNYGNWPELSFENNSEHKYIPILNPSDNDKARRDRIFFFAACVAALRNALQKKIGYYDKDKTYYINIISSESENIDLVSIHNPYMNKNKPYGDVKGGTMATIRSFVRKYSPDLVPFVYLGPDSESDNEYKTTIPLPFVKNSDDIVNE